MHVSEPDSAGSIDIRHAENRFTSTRDGITTHHSFSFDAHYDATNVSFGPLIAHNDELLAPRAGYEAHGHRDVDIVTWVLEGTLLHEDSTGTRSTVTSGTVQRLTAGTGVTHSESNGGGPDETLRFVQLWFALPTTDVSPSYGTWTLEDEDDGVGFTTVADSGPGPHGSTTLAAPGVDVAVGYLDAETQAAIGGPDMGHPHFHLYVATGSLRTREGDQLMPGDAVRSTGPGLTFTALQRTELIVVYLSAEAQGRSR